MTLDRVVTALAELLNGIAAYILMPLLAILVCVDVVTRYFFETPLQWLHESTTLTLLIVFIASLPLCTRLDRNIRIEMFYENFGPRAKAWTDIFGDLCGIGFIGLLAYHAFLQAPGMYRRGDGAEFIDIPYWPITTFVGLASTYLCILFLVDILRAGLVLRRGAR